MIELKFSFQVTSDGEVRIQNKDKFLKDMSNFPNTLFTATFKKARKERSNKQNGFYWSNFIESQIECFKEMWGESYSKEQIHDWNKCNLWCDELIVGDEIFKIPQSSTKFSTVEWEERLEIGRTFFLNKFDWVLPYPNMQSAIDLDAPHNNMYPSIDY